MRIATVKVKGLTPYSQSRPHQSVKEKSESFDEFENRAWREHIHVDEDGDVVMPISVILKGMASSAQYLSAGGELKKRGTAKWTQNFRAGLAMAKAAKIGKKPEDARPERVFCKANPANPKGSGSVWRVFPIFDEWSATLEIHLLDDTIPEDVFTKVTEAFGLFNGVGRARPQMSPYGLGRFVVVEVVIKEI